MGGLLGALPPAEFLRAANAYLLRQNWDEGFATAAHLALSLDTGSFEVRTAGHPPAVQWLAGSGRWKVHASAGPVLGVLDEADYEPVLGQVSHGDVVIMYTDGMVETRFQDFTMGIDKMIGQAERLMGGGWLNSAERLLEGVNEPGDDRAIFVVNRR
jgi:serine phosphatase RsbU (regulator of sigma subunit)